MSSQPPSGSHNHLNGDLAGLARHAAGLDIRDIPAPTVAMAKVCFADFVRCLLTGMDLPWSRAAVNIALESGSGATTLLSTRREVPTSAAIFAHAVLGQSTLGEDMHLASLTHPGSIVIPAALAAAESRGATGAQFLEGVIVGYDVLCKVGEAFQGPLFTHSAFRPIGLFGPLGAAAATSRVLGLSPQETECALSIAAGSTVALREWAFAGTTDVYFHNGFAAQNGYLSALLARNGVCGPQSIVSGRAGMAKAYGAGLVDLDDLNRSLGESYEVDRVLFKPFAACGAIQSVLQVAESLAARLPPIDWTTIREIEVATHEHGKVNPGCDNPGPYGGLGQAQMSNQLGVVLALSFGRATVDTYAEHFADASIRSRTDRVRVLQDPVFSAAYPALSPARIVIEWNDGSTSVGEQTDLKWRSAAETLDDAQADMRNVAGDVATESWIDAWESLEEQPFLTMLTRTRDCLGGNRSA